MIVPKSLHEDIKHLLHVGHLGIVKIKEKSRDVLYWSGINDDMENIVNTCDTCQEYQNQQKGEILIVHDIPTTPWTKVDNDLFQLKCKSYLVVVDYTTNIFDISLLLNKRSATVVTHTKRIFYRFKIPKKVVSENGPEYAGRYYRLFAKQWDFKHDSASPHYSKSKGQIERTIQTIKKTLKKTFKSSEDPYLSLLALRISPGPSNNTQPATLLYSIPIRTILPSMNTNIAIKNKKIYRKSNSDEYNYTNLPQFKKTVKSDYMIDKLEDKRRNC